MTAARHTGASVPTVMSKNTRGQAIFVRLRGFKMISFQSGGFSSKVLHGSGEIYRVQPFCQFSRDLFVSGLGVLRIEVENVAVY